MLTPDILDRLSTAVQAARDKKAFELVTLDVSGMTSLADSFMLCSGASDRQVKAIADALTERLRDQGCRPLHVEGEGRTGWILLDYGDFIVHVLSEEKRAYYNLESIWGDAPQVEIE